MACTTSLKKARPLSLVQQSSDRDPRHVEASGSAQRNCLSPLPRRQPRLDFRREDCYTILAVASSPPTRGLGVAGVMSRQWGPGTHDAASGIDRGAVCPKVLSCLAWAPRGRRRSAGAASARGVVPRAVFVPDREWETSFPVVPRSAGPPVHCPPRRLYFPSRSDSCVRSGSLPHPPMRFFLAPYRVSFGSDLAVNTSAPSEAGVERGSAFSW